jgi:5-methylcytosine-specific restriction endonuclease McrA
MRYSLQYRNLLKCSDWLRKREKILNRDNHQCKNCGSRENLQVHHRQYHINAKTGHKKKPWEYDQKYLITLCQECHEIGHNQYIIPIFKT